MRFMPNERKNQLQKVIDTLRIAGRSETYFCSSD
jgi:hypothetical protein